MQRSNFKRNNTKNRSNNFEQNNMNQMMGGQNAGGPFQHAVHTLQLGEYEERPRANLQSVIQKLRETNKAYKHVLVVGKIMDDDMRKNKNQEPAIKAFYESIIDPEED